MNAPEAAVNPPAEPAPSVELEQAITGTPPADAPPVDAPPVEEPPAPEPERIPIKWNGQERALTREELIEHAQKGFDYTQKAQQLADQRKLVSQVANVLAAERARMQEFLSNRDALQQHLASLGHAPQAPAPDEVPTIQQVQELLKEQTEAARKQILSEVEQAQFAAEQTRLEQTYRSEIDGTIKTLATEKFPLLNDYMEPDDVSALLRNAAQKFVTDQIAANPYEPVKIEAVKEAMVKAAEARQARIEAKVKANEKMKLVRDAKLTKQGIEPPGGAPPAPQPAKQFKLNDPGLTQSVIAELSAAFSRE